MKLMRIKFKIHRILCSQLDIRIVIENVNGEDFLWEDYYFVVVNILHQFINKMISTSVTLHQVPVPVPLQDSTSNCLWHQFFDKRFLTEGSSL